MRIFSGVSVITTGLLLTAPMLILTGCSATLGSPALVKAAVASYCPTQAEVNAISREYKQVTVHNNDLAGRKCPSA